MHRPCSVSTAVQEVSHVTTVEIILQAGNTYIHVNQKVIYITEME